jgi:hypothetical protein
MENAAGGQDRSILNEKLLLVLGLGSTALIFGPWWHVWIARIFLVDARR